MGKKKHKDDLPKTPYDYLIKKTRKTIKNLNMALAAYSALESMPIGESEMQRYEEETARIRIKLDEATQRLQELLVERLDFLKEALH